MRNIKNDSDESFYKSVDNFLVFMLALLEKIYKI